MTDEINSKSYWNHRFSDDWRTFSGPDQTKFFAGIAIRSIPSWLVRTINAKQLTLCDWGCAEGDALGLFSRYIPSCQLFGIDFSEVAINIASKKYPHINFKSVDWLNGPDNNTKKKDFDIVFSSNTLEHFHDPRTPLKQLALHAKNYIILALPYREDNPIDEHFFSFFPDSIPGTINDDFSIIYSNVVNCRKFDKTYWSGEQIILVYASPNALSDFSDLSLKDRSITLEDTNWLLTEQNSFKKNQADTERLRTEHAKSIAALEQALQQKEANLLACQQQAALAQADTERLRTEHAKSIAALEQTLFEVLQQKDSLIEASLINSKYLRRHDASKIVLKSDNYNTHQITKLANSINNIENGLHLIQDQKRTRLFFFYGMNEWLFRTQRPQHLVNNLAEIGNLIIYISPSFIKSYEPGYIIQKIRNGIYEISLNCAYCASIHETPPQPQTNQQLLFGLNQFISTYVKRGFINVLQHPFWYPIAISTIKEEDLFIYDQFDNIKAFPGTPTATIDLEKYIIKNSDFIFCSSDYLLNITKRQTSAPCYIIRNACDYNHFKVAENFSDSGIIGYFGAIEEWLDLDLIRKIALAFPDSEIHLIGQDIISASCELRDLPSVRFLGEQPYQNLPYYLSTFSVCIIPFKISHLTLATDPVKLYEYLASGKPVVSTNLPELAEAKDLICISDNHEDFIENITSCLIDRDDIIRKRRIEFSMKNTWKDRSESIIRIIESFEQKL